VLLTIGKDELETDRMKPHPTRIAGGDNGFCVSRIADQGMADGGKVNPDLVGSSRLQRYLNQSYFIPLGKTPVVGSRRATLVNHSHPGRAQWVSPDWGLDRPRRRRQLSGCKRPVGASHPALLEFLLQEAVHFCSASYK
jgi:hypothetical protein